MFTFALLEEDQLTLSEISADVLSLYVAVAVNCFAPYRSTVTVEEGEILIDEIVLAV
jgi:hypothetical protein